MQYQDKTIYLLEINKKIKLYQLLCIYHDHKQKNIGCNQFEATIATVEIQFDDFLWMIII